MSIRSDLIKEAKLFYTKNWRDCDETITDAIKTCALEFEALDSIKSSNRSRSITAKVQKHFDVAFMDYVQRNNGVMLNDIDAFSELIALDPADADRQLEFWGKAVSSSWPRCKARSIYLLGAGNVPVLDAKSMDDLMDGALRTTDALRDFIRLCHVFSKTREDTLQQTHSNGLIEQNEKRKRTKSIRGEKSVEFNRIANSRPYCELCWKLNENEVHRKFLIQKGDLDDNGLTFQVKSLSSRYCIDHNPSTSQYKRDSKKRANFYFVVLVISKARIILNLKPLEQADLRLAAHEIACSISRVQTKLKQSLKRYLDSSHRQSLCNIFSNDQVVNLAHDIIDEACSKGYEPHLDLLR